MVTMGLVCRSHHRLYGTNPHLLKLPAKRKDATSLLMRCGDLRRDRDPCGRNAGTADQVSAQPQAALRGTGKGKLRKNACSPRRKWQRLMAPAIILRLAGKRCAEHFWALHSCSRWPALSVTRCGNGPCTGKLRYFHVDVGHQRDFVGLLLSETVVDWSK